MQEVVDRLNRGCYDDCMHELLNRSPLTADAIDVQPATISDRAAIYHLTEHVYRVHFNLDWWTFDHWLYADRPSNAIWLARLNGQIIGVILAAVDESPIAWLRAAAIANGYSADPIFSALLQHAAAPLRTQGADQIVGLAHPDWLANLLPRVQFTPLTEVETYRKSDRVLPIPARAHDITIRGAVPDDVPAITVNDRAAFAPVWWHSQASMAHILSVVSQFIVAEIDGRIVGHAFSDLYGGQGHLIRLVVHPAYQGHGIGEQLLTKSLEFQIQAQAFPYTLNTQIDNVASQALYRRYGYRSLGRSVKVMHNRL
jgi:ribosomal-protein-alanine N-acetyltransferase